MFLLTSVRCFEDIDLAELDNVAGGRMSLARECARVVIICVAVGVGAGFFEDGRVVDLPHARLARLRLVVGAAATIQVGVECLARTLAGNHLLAVVDGQLFRTVDVTVATGRVAVVVRLGILVEGARNRIHLHRHIVAIDQADVVVVLATVAIELDLGQCHRRHATGTMALDLVAAVTRKAVAMAIAMRSPPEASTPGLGHAELARLVRLQLEATIERQLVARVVQYARPDGEATVVDYMNLVRAHGRHQRSESKDQLHCCCWFDQLWWSLGQTSNRMLWLDTIRLILYQHRVVVVVVVVLLN